VHALAAPKPSTVTMSLLDRLLVVVVLAAAAWWALSRTRRPAALEALSVVALAVQAMAGDPRFKVGVNLDGKLFGAEPDARLDRPFLWIQSGAAPTAEYTHGRDRLFNGLRDGGALVTIRGSIHMSFTDGPSYLTALGRRLVGGESVGSISTVDMTAMTGDMISAFVGPSLGVTNGSNFDQVIARNSAIRSDRRIAPKPS
jgi:hypothetical protein